jgi:Rod binding domain-containing protein
MADTTAISSGQSGLLDAQAAQLVDRARSTRAQLGTTQAGATQLGLTKDQQENAKIDKSSRDFESILLSSWLQGAEKSFATVPGGDGEDDDDSSKDQFQGIAMQALGSSLTASGGIGIAKMIAQHLHKAPHQQAAPEPGKTSQAGGVTTLKG